MRSPLSEKHLDFTEKNTDTALTFRAFRSKRRRGRRNSLAGRNHAGIPRATAATLCSAACMGVSGVGSQVVASFSISTIRKTKACVGRTIHAFPRCLSSRAMIIPS